VNDLRVRIATILGWTPAEVNSFSLRSLREVLRTNHPPRRVISPVSPGSKLADEISGVLQRGDHIVDRDSHMVVDEHVDEE